ncbi:MAG: VOC family protein [Clostridiales bacterium]|nr:VOC family protein [Clostridiales bacterium]
MRNELKIKLYSFTIDCIDPDELASFYAALLHWVIVFSSQEYVVVAPAQTHQGGYPSLTFQRNPDFRPPVWPDTPEKQQQMAHLDFAVTLLEKAVAHAVNCGASLAKEQFSDHWRVMIDPSGHPFCFVQMKALMESEHFALL